MSGFAINDTNLLTLWVCIAVATIVFCVLIYSVAAYRHAPAPNAAELRKPSELGWALVPIAIVIAAAAPAVKNLTAKTLPIPDQAVAIVVNAHR